MGRGPRHRRARSQTRRTSSPSRSHPDNLNTVMVARRCRHSVVAVLVLYVAVFRPRLLRWGASSQEGRDPLRGDDLVDARWQTTRGVSIAARREGVWPWLVPMAY